MTETRRNSTILVSDKPSIQNQVKVLLQVFLVLRASLGFGSIFLVAFAEYNWLDKRSSDPRLKFSSPT